MAGSRRRVGAVRIVEDALAPNTPIEAIHLPLKKGKTGPTHLRSVALPTAHRPGPADLGIQTIPFRTSRDQRKAGVGPPRMIALGPTPSPTPTGPAMRRGRIDAHLARVVDVWATLPPRVREAIVAMIDAAGPISSSIVSPPK